MFNLLPENEKEKILRDYNQRRLIVFFVFVVATLCMSLVALFPSYVLSSIKLNEVETSISTVRLSKEFQEADKLQAKLSESNKKIQILNSENTELSVQDSLSQLIRVKNNGIRIRGFMFKKRATPTESSSISINGVAQNRENLSLFISELKKIEHFKEVNIPVSSFTKDINADFVIDITTDL